MNLDAVRALAMAEATRLCDNALAAIVKRGATPDQIDRAERYQAAEFSRTSKRTERVVHEVAEASTRSELLTAIGVYCDTGIAEVGRRFLTVVA